MQQDDVSVAKVCLLAGKIMLQSGAETYRVEDTMNRIAASYGLKKAESYATPTGIQFSTEGEATYFRRISNRSTDLHKIAEVNHISRQISAQTIEPKEALLHLKGIQHASESFPYWIQMIAAAFVSGSFTIMFGGAWPDFLPSFFAGGIGFFAMIWFEKVVEIRFIAEFFASFMIAIASGIAIHIGFGIQMDKIIIGAVMPLVPGLHITNAVRDLMAGHLVAGVSKGVEAILTAFAIGAGVAVVFAII
ncbi:threonine/serine exporter family protein [Virgibacillus salexigens]|uniref:Inner membrane protein YjjP n=2 Tax=Virgibacillus TaxID=84406 RepID=A0A024Q786_9BACI|nr:MULTISPECIES: threonine/serine exporter family protein [Virgibacillus]MYL40863.1 threonine/serine exporter [Virgibacillus massiliensis]GGJ52426.1 membrane protein [Virgibacillus kapii]CDQ38339.1 Inner membrane protein YjjP [Virgibacillus massiliensis]